MKKNIFYIIILTMIFTINANAQKLNVLFDNTHAQSAGNSNWTIKGAYSDFADLLKQNGYNIIKKRIYLYESLDNINTIIIPEPNNPFNQAEIKNLLKFVKNGGNLFLIANHKGADRNGNGYDSIKAFNEFCYHFNFKINSLSMSQVGLKLIDDKIKKNVNLVACFAGSTIKKLDNSVKTLIETKEGEPFCTLSKYYKGKVITICDSAIFDDGSGENGKNLHNVFNSKLYSHKQLAINIMDILNNKTSFPIIKNIPYQTLKKNNIVIDLAHGNANADVLDDFCEEVKKSGFTPYYNTKPFTENNIKDFNTLIIYEPNLNISKEEIKALKENKNLKIIFVSSSNFNAINKPYLNTLLSEFSSTLSFSDDQVLDNENAVEGKPWTFTGFKDNYYVTVFSTCSITNNSPENIVYLSSKKTAYTTGNTSLTKKRIPLIVSTPDKKITLIGFSLFSDYNYDYNKFKAKNNKRYRHNTENFIEYLIKSINGDV